MKHAPTFTIDTREQISLYDVETGEEFTGDRDDLICDLEGRVFNLYENGKIVKQFAVVERGAYRFDGYNTIRRKLEVGDYALQGFETALTWERKKLPDFVHWSTVEHDGRAKRELERAKDLKVNLHIIVEATIDDVFAQKYLNNIYLQRCLTTKKRHVHPNAVIGAYLRYSKLGVQVHWAGNAKTAENIVLRSLLQLYEDLRVKRTRPAAAMSDK